MAEVRSHPHPVDYRLHPVGGRWLLALGVLGLVVKGAALAGGTGAAGLRPLTSLALPASLVLLGLALVRPAGRARTWLVRGWLGLLVVAFGGMLAAFLG